MPESVRGLGQLDRYSEKVTPTRYIILYTIINPDDDKGAKQGVYMKDEREVMHFVNRTDALSACSSVKAIMKAMGYEVTTQLFETDNH